MSDLQALLKQQEELATKIQKVRDESRDNAMDQIRKIAADANLSYKDIQSLFPKNIKPKTGTRKSPEVKYRDDSGNSWTGRGVCPRWIAASGKPKEAFLVKKG